MMMGFGIPKSHNRIAPTVVSSQAILPCNKAAQGNVPLRLTIFYPRSAASTGCIAGSVLGDVAGDDEALDVAGALVDLAHPDVAVDALDREIGDIAVAAMDLDRVRGDALGHLGGEELGHRGLFDAGLTGIAPCRGVENEAARRGDLRRHIGEAEGHRLLLDDRLAEGLALAGVGEGRLVGRTRHADGLRGDADAAALEVSERDLVAFAFAAEH